MHEMFLFENAFTYQGRPLLARKSGLKHLLHTEYLWERHFFYGYVSCISYERIKLLLRTSSSNHCWSPIGELFWHGKFRFHARYFIQYSFILD